MPDTAGYGWVVRSFLGHVEMIFQVHKLAPFAHTLPRHNLSPW